MFLIKWKRLIEKYMEKNVHTRRMQYLSVFSIIMVPLSTYRVGTRESPFHYTLSMMGNRFGHRLDFIVRGVITGTMLLLFILRLYSLRSFKDKTARNLLFLATAMLIITVFVPATKSLPMLWWVHYGTGIVFAICLTISLFLFTLRFPHKNRTVHIQSMALLYVTIGGSLALLAIFGRTGVFELFFFFALTIFLVLLEYWTGDKRTGTSSKHINI